MKQLKDQVEMLRKQVARIWRRDGEAFPEQPGHFGEGVVAETSGHVYAQEGSC